MKVNSNPAQDTVFTGPAAHSRLMISLTGDAPSKRVTASTTPAFVRPKSIRN